MLSCLPKKLCIHVAAYACTPASTRTIRHIAARYLHTLKVPVSRSPQNEYTQKRKYNQAGPHKRHNRPSQSAFAAVKQPKSDPETRHQHPRHIPSP